MPRLGPWWSMRRVRGRASARLGNSESIGGREDRQQGRAIAAPADPSVDASARQVSALFRHHREPADWRSRRDLRTECPSHTREEPAWERHVSLDRSNSEFGELAVWHDEEIWLALSRAPTGDLATLLDLATTLRPATPDEAARLDALAADS